MAINWIQYPDSLTFNTSDKIIVSSPDGNTKNLSFPFTSSPSGITFNSDTYFTNLTEQEEEFSVMVGPDGKLYKSTHPGERSRIQVRNGEGATIPAGAPLYSKGEIGGSERILVGVCDSGDTAKMPCIGVAEFEMNTTGTKDSFAITQGVYNTNIHGFTGLSESDILYVNGGSAPHLTKTKPTNGDLIQNVGVVIKTNGTICQGLLVAAIGRTNDVPWPLYVDHANQLVGIGTSSPSHKLTISSSNDTTAVGIDIGSSAGFDFAANSSSGYSTLFYMDDVGLDIGHNSTSRALNFKTGSTDRLTITGGGNVLIGTTADSGAKSTIAGQAALLGNGFYGLLNLSGTNALADYNTANKIVMHSNGSTDGLYTGGLHLTRRTFSQQGDYGSDIRGLSVGTVLQDNALELYTSTNTQKNATRLTITSGGNLLIGTTTDNGYKLQVKTDTGNNYLSLISPTGNNSGILFNDGNHRALLAVDTTDAMVFYVGGINERARITSGGNLLIGTTTDNGHKLQVNGDIQIGDNNMLRLGDSSDLKLYHTGTGTVIQNSVGNLTIQQDQNSGDIIFRCDDGTGGTTPYITLDGGLTLTKFSKNTVCDDGTGGTTPYITLDGGLTLTKFSKNTVHSNNVNAYFGSSSVANIKHTGSDFFIENSTGDFTIKQKTNGADLILSCDDGAGGNAAYITLDGSQTTINLQKNVLIGTTVDSGVYKLDVSGKARVQSVFELDDVLTLNQISTPADPASGQSSIYMDSADGAIKCKINVGGTVVTRTIASFE